MARKILSGISLILLIPLLLAGADKSKKTYELIYKDIQLLKQQILQLEKKIGKNREDIQAVNRQLAELITSSKLLQSEIASSKDNQNKLPAQYQIILEKIEGIYSILSKFSEELIEIKRVSIPPPEQEEKSEPEQPKDTAATKEKEQKEETNPQPTISPNLSPSEVFNMARSDYLKGNFQLAIEGFTIYKSEFPDSPLVDDALYWIGECYFSQEKFKEAIAQFNELILNFPKSNKNPAAYLKKGISLISLGKNEEAISAFKLLISKYPLEEETKIAQEKIKELESKYERY